MRRNSNVRFGSKADIQAPSSDVRFTPKADMDWHSPDVRFVPKADSCTAAIFIVIRSPGRRGQAAEAIAGPSALAVFRWNVGRISIDKSFKFNAVQQLRAVACLI